MANEEKLLQEIEELKRINKEQDEIIKYLKQLLFGKKTEKMPVNENQTSLFDDKELDEMAEDVEYDEVVEKTTKAVVRHHSKKPEVSKRKKYLDKLEQVDQLHALSQQDLICPDCHQAMEKIGTRVASREVELEPARVYCVNHLVETAK